MSFNPKPKTKQKTKFCIRVQNDKIKIKLFICFPDEKNISDLENNEVIKQKPIHTFEEAVALTGI